MTCVRKLHGSPKMILLCENPGTKGTRQWGEECLFYVFMSNKFSKDQRFILMIDAVMRDGVQGALCWWTPGSQWHDGQMGRNQDSTLVFCESTSCMLMTSVLTPLSYTGLLKADSSVMFSYGGEDVGVRIVFPWSLSNEQRHRECTVPAHLIPTGINQVLCEYLLRKVDINPKDNHQDDCSWNEDSKGNIGSLHGVIHINNYERKKQQNTKY